MKKSEQRKQAMKFNNRSTKCFRPNYCPMSGKVRFRDHEEAVEAIKAAATQRQWHAAEGTETRRRECRTYRCEVCKGWHLTSQPAPVSSDLRLAA